MRCSACGNQVHPERAEISEYCVSCVDNDWRLVRKARVIVHTAHKQGPMVSRPDMYDGVSAYDRG